MKKMMKTLIATVAFMAAAYAHANTKLYTCGANGFALAEMSIVEKDSKSTVISVQISETDNAPVKEYEIRSGLNDFKAGTSATLILQKKNGQQGGGARYDAGLLRILDGQNSALLALGGAVYNLKCTRTAEAPQIKFIPLESDMIFKKVTNKGSDSDTFLFIRKDGAAQVKKISYNSQKAEIIFQGKLGGAHPYYVIDRKEGDICPSVEVALFPDSVKGKNQSAGVRSLFAKAGHEVKQYCQSAQIMDGAYVRIK